MPWGSDRLALVVFALALDALIGDPDMLWRRVPHPVVWFGRLIAILDDTLNRESMRESTRRIAGILALVVLLGIAALIGWLAEVWLSRWVGGGFAIALLASVFLAQNSLYAHVARVGAAFSTGGIEAARQAVAMIVGRDPNSLDEAGIARAAIESCAENFSDGVVAPSFWFALLGLPGLLAYKALNTADSMIGHRNPRHEAFGWAAARLDDLANLVPARLAGLIIALVAPIAGGRVAVVSKITWRDARLHRSPNAGWPESAMAGALGVALAGPRRYGVVRVDDPFLHREGREARAADIGKALRILMAASALHAALYGALALLV